MRFLIDAQLPPSLARWLGERGYSASAARDEGLRDADDGSICNFAMKGMWIIVTKDEDMVDRARLPRQQVHAWYGLESETALTPNFFNGWNHSGHESSLNLTKASMSWKPAASPPTFADCGPQPAKHPLPSSPIGGSPFSPRPPRPLRETFPTPAEPLSRKTGPSQRRAVSQPSAPLPLPHPKSKIQN